jgi:RiboL-PSP-HEPN
MASASLAALDAGLTEVRELLRAEPPRATRGDSSLTVTRAIGRAAVVILSSHLEGYVDSLNVEAATVVNGASIRASGLDHTLRLLHSRPAVDELAATSWETTSRRDHLERFIASDGWLWGADMRGELQPDRLLTWMKSPGPRALRRYFRYWGIEDIFSSITRKASTRSDLWRRIAELVDKRNSIAHGDIGTTATEVDVRAYLRAVDVFSTRADRVMARELGRLCRTPDPW